MCQILNTHLEHTGILALAYQQIHRGFYCPLLLAIGQSHQMPCGRIVGYQQARNKLLAAKLLKSGHNVFSKKLRGFRYISDCHVVLIKEPHDYFSSLVPTFDALRDKGNKFSY